MKHERQKVKAGFSSQWGWYSHRYHGFCIEGKGIFLVLTLKNREVNEMRKWESIEQGVSKLKGENHVVDHITKKIFIYFTKLKPSDYVLNLTSVQWKQIKRKNSQFKSYKIIHLKS